MKEVIQQKLEDLCNTMLKDTPNQNGYTDRDLFNACFIFSTTLIDVMYTENKDKLSQEDMKEIAETTGLAIRELVRVTTGKDTTKLI